MDGPVITSCRLCAPGMLWNLALWDQGAPPVAARSARRVGNVDRVHRGTAGYRSAHAGRPARRSPLAATGAPPPAARRTKSQDR
jgi:hypothetical protein